jgi:Cu/Ag efflux pump CusA
MISSDTAATATKGVPVTLGDVATVQIGPEARRGIGELDGPAKP